MVTFSYEFHRNSHGGTKTNIDMKGSRAVPRKIYSEKKHTVDTVNLSL